MRVMSGGLGNVYISVLLVSSSIQRDRSLLIESHMGLSEVDL